MKNVAARNNGPTHIPFCVLQDTKLWSTVRFKKRCGIKPMHM